MIRTLIPAALLVLTLTGPVSAEDEIDVDRLPIDIQRIVRALQLSTIREEREGLNLRYYVSIYGEAPQIEIFTREDNLLTGPVPRTAPTHQEFLEHVTPRQFQTSVMNIGAAMRWLSELLSRTTSERSR